ncbi:MAG: carbamate kinase [Candidatus Marsarchaeota archaeon]|nr:carbamate kinase [Candidatus Marsarchaeota archaeon]
MLYVIAVGGNALDNRKVLYKLSYSIAGLKAAGHGIVVTHGNGPQVGRLAMHEKKSLALLTKETEASIGAMIKRSITRADKAIGSRAKLIYTHVLVDKDDPEFDNPTKPIGEFCSQRRARKLARRGFVMKRLLKGYRRVVPSPEPRAVLELGEIRRALREGRVVIAAGGGGIAVTKSRPQLRYADAVIDKDLASSFLAIKLHADRFVILTNVDGIFLGFHTSKTKMLKKVTAGALMRYALTEHFEAGSMLPKATACVNFAAKKGKFAVVGNLAKADSVFRLRDATIVVP